jgi:hypothetical protein
MFSEFMLPLITKRKIHGYRQKLIEQDKSDSKPLLNLPDFLSKHFSTILVIAVSLMILFSIAGMEGERVATTKEDFLIPSSHPQSIILKTYRDYLICAELNINTRSIKPGFFFIKLGDDPNLKLISHKLGPLVVN